MQFYLSLQGQPPSSPMLLRCSLHPSHPCLPPHCPCPQIYLYSCVDAAEVASVMSDSVRPHRCQPTRLRCPWDSPGKNTGVGCHFLLQCTKVKSESEVTQLCPTLSDPMDCSPPGSSAQGIFQPRVGAHHTSTKSVALHFQSDFLELWGTVSQSSAELLSR